jgi:hypothetical protein
MVHCSLKQALGFEGRLSFQREENVEYMVVDIVGFGETQQGTITNV